MSNKSTTTATPEDFKGCEVTGIFSFGRFVCELFAYILTAGATSFVKLCFGKRGVTETAIETVGLGHTIAKQTNAVAEKGFSNILGDMDEANISGSTETTT